MLQKANIRNELESDNGGLGNVIARKQAGIDESKKSLQKVIEYSNMLKRKLLCRRSRLMDGCRVGGMESDIGDVLSDTLHA